MNENDIDLKTSTGYDHIYGDYTPLGLDRLLNVIKAETGKINAANIDEMIEDGIISAQKLNKKQSNIFTQNIQIYKNKPSIIFNANTTGDTDWYISNYNDADGTSQDSLLFGYGVTPGTTPTFELQPDGDAYLKLGDLYLNAGTLYQYSSGSDKHYLYHYSVDYPTEWAYIGLNPVGKNFTYNITWSPSSTMNLPRTMLSLSHSEAPSTAIDKLCFASSGNCYITFGTDDVFWATSGGNATSGFYYSHYMRDGTSLISAASASVSHRMVSYESGYCAYGDTATGATAAGLKLYGGSGTARIIIESTGVVKITNFTSTGMVKNLADGTLVSGGTVLNTVSVKTTSYVITSYDGTIVCNSASALTITLPAASASGAAYTIKNINTGVVTLEGDSSDTIDGELNQALNQWDSITVIDYLANAWIII